jgi:hypothetical protein
MPWLNVPLVALKWYVVVGLNSVTHAELDMVDVFVMINRKWFSMQLLILVLFVGFYVTDSVFLLHILTANIFFAARNSVGM